MIEKKKLKVKKQYLEKLRYLKSIMRVTTIKAILLSPTLFMIT